MQTYSFHPVGVLSSPRRHRYDVPRQGVLDETHEARVLLEEGRNFEQAIDDLRGFERIWLLYVFHLNEGWKPRVQVPRHRRDKVGVFATRAPYRPNPIGLSCVRLLDVEGLVLRITECDLLDGTPVLDIKPYLPYADAFPDAATGWVPATDARYRVQLEARAMQQLLWLRSEDIDILPFAETQLEEQPTDGSRKRVVALEDDSGRYELAYRTWRIVFRVDDEAHVVHVEAVRSGYTAGERADMYDPYEDKEVHRNYVKDYPWPEK
ncbi:MAG: tRNA (N6-threonylcarbamoyladenosine(37)-N6)-methyltransferase TrmO [Bacteroidota bacterium]|nr:tRNA (N6-threonylcarbamoyladenosine(37)-N6)-methyltransferase TrmO [Bacteroidota bacterium]